MIATDWNLPWTGACRCGQTRIAITAPPMVTAACHCTGCQRMSASAFSLTLSVPADGFEVTAGEPVIGGLHGEVRHHFCPHCLSWMFTRPPGGMPFVNVRAPVLDDHRWFVPFVEYYTSEKLPWASTSAVRGYPTFPPMEAYGELMEAFAKEGVRPRVT